MKTSRAIYLRSKTTIMDSRHEVKMIRRKQGEKMKGDLSF